MNRIEPQVGGVEGARVVLIVERLVVLESHTLNHEHTEFVLL